MMSNPPQPAGAHAPAVEDLPPPRRGSAATRAPTRSPARRSGRAATPRYGDGALIACDNLVRSSRSPTSRSSRCRASTCSSTQGEMIAIVGASGSGKSTLLHILGGLDVPSAGRAIVAGYDLGRIWAARADAVTAARSSGSSGSRPARNLLPYLSAVENVELPMILDGRRKAAAAGDRSCWTSSACRTGATHRPDRLSGGEQQRVAIAVALANDPKVVLADEPTGELDSRTSLEVFAPAPPGQRQLGTTIVIVTHDAVRVRAGPADGRDPRRPDLDRDAAPDRAGRRRRPPRRSARSSRSSTGPAGSSCRAAHRGARAAAPGPAPARGGPRRRLARPNGGREGPATAPADAATGRPRPGGVGAMSALSGDEARPLRRRSRRRRSSRRSTSSATTRSGDSVVHAVRGDQPLVARGELLAVRGRSGSGKTTLLNLLGGLDQPTAGTVVVDGSRSRR